jgi:hypothetical protein
MSEKISVDSKNERGTSNLKYELSENGVLIVRPQGPLRRQDFDQLASIVDSWIKAHSMLQAVVICIRHFPGWEGFGSFIHHFEFVESHEKKVKRVALAVDGVLPKLISKIAAHFVQAEVKQFPFDQEKEAIQWARNIGDQTPR